MKRHAILIAAAAFAIAGCNRNETAQAPAEPSAGAPAAPATAAAPPAENMRAFMVNVVAPAVKPIWDFSYTDKVSDADWATIKKAATDLNAALPTIASGGTVPAEQTRAKDPKWQDWLKKTAEPAAAALRAADAKNQMALAMAGDSLVETCEGCHMAFDPTAK
jgi:hypothetical protein